MWWLLFKLLPRPGLATYGVVAALVLLQLGGVDVVGFGVDVAGSLFGAVQTWLTEVIRDAVNPL